MPTYLSPGVYFEEFTPGHLGLLPTVDRPAPQAVRPIRPVRSRWKDASSTAIFIGFARQGPADEPVYVANWNNFESIFGSRIEDGFLASAVQGYFLNGGTGCWVIRSAIDAGQPSARARTSIPSDEGSTDAYEVTARYGGPITNQIELEIADSAIAPEQPARFSVSVWVEGELRERFDDVETTGPRRAADIINGLSREIELTGADEAPKRGRFRLSGWMPGDGGPNNPLAGAVRALSRSIELIEDLSDRADVVCVPDLVALHVHGLADLGELTMLQSTLISTCEAVSTITAILDSPPAMSPQQVRDWRTDVAGFDSPCAAVYYPWIAVYEPTMPGKVFVPPSGHVAGIIAKFAATAGLHRAPANETLAGAIGAEYPLNRYEIQLLHPIGINAIAAVTGEGVRILGARTMSSDPARRQLARKRVVDFVRANIQNGMGWVLYEPSEPLLWEQIVEELDSFLALLFRAGVLGGAAPENAYVVRCDAGTNPPEIRDVGQVVAEVVANLTDGSQFVSRVVFFSG